MNWLKSAFAMFIGNGLGKIFSIAFLLVAVRTFSASDYFAYRQMLLFTFTITPFIQLGTPISLGYYLGNERSIGRGREEILFQTSF